MNSRISVGRALGAGFGLISREPAAFAVWCAAYFVVSAVPLALNWNTVAPLYAMIGSGEDLSNAEFFAAQQRMMAFQPLSMLAGLAVMICLPAAVLRAVLYPDDRKYFYLRIGVREFWFGIVSLVLMMGWILATVASFIPLMLIVGIGAAFGGAGAAVAGLLMLVLMPLSFGISIWAILRLSLAPTMSFADRTFRVGEAWTLTRGHAGRLFLVGLILFGVVLLLELLALGAIVLRAGGMEALSSGAVFTGLSMLSLPVVLAASAVFSFVIVAFYVVGAAAWAEMYRQLRPAFADAFD